MELSHSFDTIPSHRPRLHQAQSCDLETLPPPPSAIISGDHGWPSSFVCCHEYLPFFSWRQTPTRPLLLQQAKQASVTVTPLSWQLWPVHVSERLPGSRDLGVSHNVTRLRHHEEAENTVPAQQPREGQVQHSPQQVVVMSDISFKLTPLVWQTVRNFAKCKISRARDDSVQHWWGGGGVLPQPRHAGLQRVPRLQGPGARGDRQTASLLQVLVSSVILFNYSILITIYYNYNYERARALCLVLIMIMNHSDDG